MDRRRSNQYEPPDDDRPLNFQEKIWMSIGSFPTDYTWTISECLMIPLLLERRCPVYLCSSIWLISPLLSYFISPFILERSDEINESASDSNACGWRGRKQFILLFDALIIICLYFIPRSDMIVSWFESDKWTNREIHSSVALQISLIFIFFVSMDSANYFSLGPLQRYYFEMNGNDEFTFNTFKEDFLSVFQSLWKLIAYFIAAFFWRKYFEIRSYGKHGQTHIQIVFTISSIVVLLFSAAFLIGSKNLEFLSMVDYSRARSADSDNENDALIPTRRSVTDDDEIDNSIAAFSCGSSRGILFVLSIFVRLFGWLTYSSLSIFWTIFVAMDVFGGIPWAKRRTTEHQKFESGLMFGIWGLLFQSIVFSLSACIFGRIEQFRFIRARSLFSVLIINEFIFSVIVISFIFTLQSREYLMTMIVLLGFPIQLHMFVSHLLTQKDLNTLVIIEDHDENGLGLIPLWIWLLEYGPFVTPWALALVGGPLVYAFKNQFVVIMVLPALLLLGTTVFFALFLSIFHYGFKKDVKDEDEQIDNIGVVA